MTEDTRNYYEVLGLDRQKMVEMPSERASNRVEIQYQARLKEEHPHINENRLEEAAHERALIHEAYAALKTSEDRVNYENELIQREKNLPFKIRKSHIQKLTRLKDKFSNEMQETFSTAEEIRNREIVDAKELKLQTQENTKYKDGRRWDQEINRVDEKWGEDYRRIDEEHAIPGRKITTSQTERIEALNEEWKATFSLASTPDMLSEINNEFIIKAQELQKIIEEQWHDKSYQLASELKPVYETHIASLRNIAKQHTDNAYNTSRGQSESQRF